MQLRDEISVLLSYNVCARNLTIFKSDKNRTKISAIDRSIGEANVIVIIPKPQATAQYIDHEVKKNPFLILYKLKRMYF